MRTSLVRMLAIVALPTLALAACGSSSKSSTGSSGTTQPAVATTTTAGSSNAKATVALADNSTIGKKVLVNSDGMTLYMSEKDTAGKSNCTGACAQAWPAATVTGTPTYGAGLSAGEFSTITGANGEKQLAVNGQPLYTWVNDKQAGDATGQDVNGIYVVGANGKKIENSSSSTNGETATTMGSSSSGNGY
jgi:predicted lipoprotein with Yx(FWY)xxD motif